MWDGTTFPFNNGTFDTDRNELFSKILKDQYKINSVEKIDKIKK